MATTTPTLSHVAALEAQLRARGVVLEPWALDVLERLDPLTTEQQLAALIGVTPRTLRAWRSSGRLKGIQTVPGGRVRYAREHVAMLLATMPQARGA